MPGPLLCSSRRAGRAAVAIVVTAACVTALGVSTASARPAPQVVEAQINDAGTTLSGTNPRHAGTVTFNVSTSAKDGSTFELIRLRPGVTGATALALGAKLND